MAYAAVADIGGKSGVEQVDRLLSNEGIALRDVMPFTTHGRATPLAWKTVEKSRPAKHRTDHELKMVKDLRAWLPEHVSVEWLADRASGYRDLYELLGSGARSAM